MPRQFVENSEGWCAQNGRVPWPEGSSAVFPAGDGDGRRRRDIHQTVQHSKDGMCPRPFPEICPSYDRAEIQSLPDILDNPATLGPVDVAFLDQILEQFDMLTRTNIKTMAIQNKVKKPKNGLSELVGFCRSNVRPFLSVRSSLIWMLFLFLCFEGEAGGDFTFGVSPCLSPSELPVAGR
ncbi:hypothetical protein KC345_g315 [Hortaea werneckii]|nr:hypothetical protein KC345_g315 [Hortaea werneckii]